jgi:hypothetical protein
MKYMVAWASRMAPFIIWIGTGTIALSLVLPSSSQDGGYKPAAQPPAVAQSDVFAAVIANQKRMEAELSVYERLQKIEVRRSGSDPNVFETKLWRVFPAGPALNKIPMPVDGQPPSAQTYRAELEKLLKYLTWASQPGQAQREAYAKAERKKKERDELLASTHEAFLFTRLGTELRGDRTLVKYSMAPNPNFKPTLRNEIIFSRVIGTLWIDEQSGELARIEGSVTEDISIAMFLARVYKGSHFMQERYELAPGLWFPTFEQYDFDGRKFLLSFSIHERTFYSDYKKVGPPSEAVQLVHNELDKLPLK